MQDFYRKRLVIEYKTHNKVAMNITKLGFWKINKPSKEVIDVYESKKKKFTDDLNKKLLNQIELSEKQAAGKNKSEELFKVQELLDKYGENYIKILQEMPHLSPYAVKDYIKFIKLSLIKDTHAQLT
jgi:hypothetical protein